MSDSTGSTNGLISQLVVKAIEKKKQKEQSIANKKNVKLEYVLFSQFDVLDSLPSKNGNTTIYHIAKRGEPNKQICCKVLNENADDFAKTMLIREASRLELSQHPSIAQFIKIGREFDRPYLMYEWIKGESVAEKMARHSSQGFRVDHVAWLIYQLAGALEYMHTRGICHLDIKPSNIIIGEDDSVKLIDFGAARYIDKPEEHAEVSLKYVSPLYIETGAAKPQDDVYSLALLTGHLFLGAIYGDAWHKQLMQGKRPLLIPASAWRLIRRVIQKPRSHQYTAISFAQELACIDTHTAKLTGNAPIFHTLRNADLVLSARRSGFRIALANAKYLEVSMVASAIIIACGYIVGMSQFSPGRTSDLLIAESDTAKTEHIVKFLAQAPWQKDVMLQKLASDKDQLDMYKDADRRLVLEMSALYNDQQSSLSAQQSSARRLNVAIADARSDLIAVKEILEKKNNLSGDAETKLINMMADLNTAYSESQIATQYLRSNEQELAQLISTGEADDVNAFLQSAWVNHQANSYFYEHVLTEKVLAKVLDSADEGAKQRFYTAAIANVESAKQFFGEHPQLVEKIRELTIARSEYILFSTVTEKAKFSADRLNVALNDLKNNSPEQFDEVTELLGRMAADAIVQSYKKTRPANGALAVQRALYDFDLMVKG